MKKAKRIIFLLAIVLTLSLVFAACTPTDTTTPPGKPQTLEATEDDAKVTLTWAAPESDGGAAVTGYQVAYRETASDTEGAWKAADSGTQHVVTGLTNDVEYTFSVRAVNSAGEGVAATITATPFKELPPLAPLSTDEKKIVTTAIDSFKAETNWQIAAKVVDEKADTTTEYTIERTGTAGTFTAKNNKTYYTKAIDNNWYRLAFDATDKFESYSTYKDTAATQKAFDDNIASTILNPISTLTNTLEARVYVATVNGKKHYTIEMHGIQTKINEIHNTVRTVTVADSKLTKIETNVTVTNKAGNQTISSTTETKTITRAFNKLTMPTVWQDSVLGPNGWANTAKQLSDGLSRTASERDKWNDDDYNGIYLAAFAEIPNTFKYIEKGRFDFDPDTINDAAIQKKAWEAYKVYYIYDMSGMTGDPIDLNSKGLFNQFSNHPVLGGPFLEQVGDNEALVKNNDTLIRSLVLGNADGLIEDYAGIKLDDAKKKTMILGMMTGASVTVRYSRVRNFVYETDTDPRIATPVRVEYTGNIGDMPGVITATQRETLETALENFDKSTNWKMESKIDDGENEVIEIIEKTGKGSTNNFVGVVRDDSRDVYFAKNGNYWYAFSEDGQGSFDAHFRYTTATGAEDAMHNNYPHFFTFITDFDEFGNSTYKKEGATETFTCWEITAQGKEEWIIVIEGGIVVKASFKKENNGTVTGEAVYEIKYGITSIDVPAGWAAYDVGDQFAGPATTVGQLTEGVEATIADHGNWTTDPSDTRALFRLQRYKEYSKFFKTTATPGTFEFDEDTLTNPGNLVEMWRTYQLSFYYFTLNADMTGGGNLTLFRILIKQMIDQNLGSTEAAMAKSLIDGMDDAELAESALTGMISSFVFAAYNTSDAKKNAIKADLNGVTITVINGKITKYTEKGGALHIIDYN